MEGRRKKRNALQRDDRGSRLEWFGDISKRVMQQYRREKNFQGFSGNMILYELKAEYIRRKRKGVDLG